MRRRAVLSRALALARLEARARWSCTEQSVSDKPVIFISYSHKDRAWLDYVRSFFEPLAAHWNLQIWDDEKLRIGDDWRGDIYAALYVCRVFILLVSRYALASSFIINEEVGRILKRPKGEVRFCPIVVTPYYARPLPWLDQPNRRPPDNKSLFDLPDAARDREMAIIAEQIDKIIQTFSGAGLEILPAPPTALSTRKSFPSIVDYGRLPETPYKTLVGRETELKQLDGAWADRTTRIISLIAWGGAGKTSLVMEWLTRVRNDAYRGADAVLCWSFYSQGTQERAAAGEGLLDWALSKLKVKIDTTSSAAKGERLAEELSRRRVLLVLDGLEPLQFGPEGQEGALKEHGLRTFLRALAMRQPQASHSLVVITSRLPVRDLTKWADSTAPKIDLWRLSDEAGAVLLAEAGVEGPSDELRAATQDFAGHALALSLLAGFLKLLHKADVRARHAVRSVREDQSGHDQARRVVEAFDREWLRREPALRGILFIVGLFDRPAQAAWIKALRAKPVIDGLTEAIADLDDSAWRTAIARLREVRLLDPEDSLSPDALDTHPLVREWFGESLHQKNYAAWRAAHGRLYEYLRDTTQEGDTPTLEDLAPLYQAIAHGCRAGRHQEVLDDVYTDRICRRRPDGRIEFYSRAKLGAIGSDLVALSWFFHRAFATPVVRLSRQDQAWVLDQAGLRLRAQGLVAQALTAERAALQMYEDNWGWSNAASVASNVSAAELLVGEVDTAVATAKRSVANADRSDDFALRMVTRSTLAAAMHAVGSLSDASTQFAEAEKLQASRTHIYPLLYSLQGYLYCELLLTQGEYADAYTRAAKILEWEDDSDPLLDRALVRLGLGRSSLGRALAGALTPQLASTSAREAGTRLDAAAEIMRATGISEFIPLSLFARANFRRSVGNCSSAARDLDEIEEIGDSGPMRLFLCDLALERARLAFAQIEAFAPLNGMLEKDNPPKPEVPSPEKIAELKAEAERQIKIADDYIQSCGYHRRDEELAELKEVLAGKRMFASLPPRV
jgi:tetratricopeptide (TPR) repeat protein